MTHDDMRDALAALEEWLETQLADDGDEVMFSEEDVDDLRVVGRLALSNAPEAQLRAAVHRARDAGWSWPPLALSLGLSVPEVRRRYPSPPARRPARTWPSRLRSRLGRPEKPAASGSARSGDQRAVRTTKSRWSGRR